MTSSEHPNNAAEPIAVVAIGSIFPGRGDTTGFWRDIVEGVDTFTSVPSTHWLTDDFYDSDKSARDRTYGSRGAFVPPTSFDPLAFGVPPNSLSTTDTAQLLALVAARNVLEDIERETAGPLDKSRASVILGVAAATELAGQMVGRLQRPAWVKGMREAGLDEAQVQDIADRISTNFVEWKETTFPGLLGNVVAGRIANRLDFGGSNYVTDAACASSLSAMQIALHELQAGDSDLVLTGGVDALNDIFMYMCFSKTPALSPSGDCRPLSADADGTMLGEGVGMMALRRLSDAERDGNRIHAIIKGLGGGSDGRSTAVYAPLASGQERTLTRAYQKAGYSPRTVELVEAHGTGTVAGDKTELEALHSVFDPQGDADAPWCALGSVKAQIGHTKAAAGAAGLLKVIGGLSRKILPPTIKVRQPAEALCKDTPFYLGTQARPWIRGSAHPRRASVSSFGFGGSNFHVTLEEYTGKNAVQPTRVMPSELLLFSTFTAAGLCEQIENVVQSVAHEDDLARIATQTWSDFDPKHAHRAAIVAETPQHLTTLCEKLLALISQSKGSPALPNRHIHYSEGHAASGKLALVFSGQGSQYVGMGSDIAMAFEQARAVWDSACDIQATAGLKLHDLAFPPTLFTDEASQAASARLTDMRHAQPAIAAVALSQLALLEQLGVQADMQVGHSFGEVMALHSAGVFDAPTALTIACERANTMSTAAATSSGGMLAVQASVGVVTDVLADMLSSVGDGITLANDNAPEQVILSGNTAKLQHVASVLSNQGINSQMLPVAAAFHSPQVDQAVQPFAQKLLAHTLAAPATPVYANSTAGLYTDDKANMVQLLSEQIGKPVRFREALLAMHAAGATTFLEVGPGSVLTNLVRKTLPISGVSAIALDDKHSNGTTSLLCAVGELAVSGIAVDIASLYAGLPAPLERVAPGKFAVDILGSNYQKPYPPQGEQIEAPSRGAKGSKLSEPHSERTVSAAFTPELSNGASSTKMTPSSALTGMQKVPQSGNAQSAAPAVRSASGSGSVQVLQTRNSTRSTPLASAVDVTSHQPSAAAKSTMVMQNQSSASSEAIQCQQSQSGSETPQTNGANHTSVMSESTAQPAALSDSIRRTLFNDVSARHADYMAAVTAAHQSYLNLAAGLIGAGAGTALTMPAEQIAPLNHMEMPTDMVTMSAPSMPVAPTALNGHSHMNGVSHSVHNGVSAGAYNGAASAIHHSAPNNAPNAESFAVPVAPATPVVSSSAAPANTPSVPVVTNGSGNPAAAQAPTAAATSSSAAQSQNASASAAPLVNGSATPAIGNGAANGAAEPKISTDLVRMLIAEKTGYPVEMIEDDMDLSGELGIDSIKQVEVLSALRKQVPDIKDVGTADMGQLRTIRQIADFFG